MRKHDGLDDRDPAFQVPADVGAQCPKRLWPEVHEPWRAEIDAGAQARFATGHRVGEVARSLYPEGRLIGHADDLAAALAETQAALAADGDLLLFEPAFRHGDVLVRADLLFRRNGRHRLVEVKATTEVKDHHLQDAAIQAWVIEGAGYPVDGLSIAHVDASFVYPGGGDYRGLLKSVDVSEEVPALRAEVPRLLLRCQQIVAAAMPDIAVGKQCDSPYACQFQPWCDRDRPEHPVDILGCDWRLRDRLVEQRYRDLRDVPEEAIGDGLPHRIWSAAVTGASFTDPGAADLLRDLPYPRYYLDFETIQFAVPIWPGTRPYEQLPFQWSCTIEHVDGTLDHREFLDRSGEAPMRTCLQALVESIGGDGPVFSYTDFEGRVLREGRACYPDLAAELDAIALRLVDMYPIARSHYYHPAQNGSWSIKRLLPTIAPDLDYANLDYVADGTSAQVAYLEMVDPGTGDERRARLAEALRVYCRRDTEGMVRIAQHNGDRYNLAMAVISVLAAVVRRNDKYLVCQRPTHKRHGGLWEFPGGKLEPGETYLDAAKRELAEELGVEAIAVGSPLCSIADPGSAFLIKFVPTEIVGEPHCLEHINLKWLPVDQLSSLQLAPSDQRFVEFLRSEA